MAGGRGERLSGRLATATAHDVGPEVNQVHAPGWFSDLDVHPDR